MSVLRCECGHEIFECLAPCKIEEGNFRIWRINEKLRPDVFTVPVMKCICCGRIQVPSASIPGKNQLDPEVIAYKELMGVVIEQNSRIKKNEELFSFVDFILKKVNDLEDSNKQILAVGIGGKGSISTEEVDGVETVKSSKRNSK